MDSKELLKTDEKAGNDEEVDNIIEELDDILDNISEDLTEEDKLSFCYNDEPASTSNNETKQISKVEEDFEQSSDVDEDFLNFVDSLEAKDAAKTNTQRVIEKTSFKDDSGDDSIIAEKTKEDKGKTKDSPTSSTEKTEDTSPQKIFQEEKNERDFATEKISAISPKSSVIIEKNCETNKESADSSQPKLLTSNIDVAGTLLDTMRVTTEDRILDKESVALETKNATITTSSSTDVIPKKGDDEEAMDVDMDLEEDKLTAKEKTAIKNTNDEAGTSNTSKLTESPEELFNLLKMLPPEKLELIKSQILNNSLEETKSVKIAPEKPSTEEPELNVDKNIAKWNCAENSEEPMEMDIIEPEAEIEQKEDENNFGKQNEEKMEVDIIEPKVTSEKDKISTEDVPRPMTVDNNEDDCVILLDSDEETENKDKPFEGEQSIQESINTPVQTSSEQQQSYAGNEQRPPKVMSPKRFECVNNDCSRDSNDFVESPQFILNFFGATKKPNKIQYVCSSCYDKAIIKFEEMGEALLNNRPIFDIEVPKKNEMVEVIDSDDEDDSSEPRFGPASEKIVWNRKVELEVEDILKNLCETIDFKKQLKFGEDDFKERCAKLAANQEKLEKDMKAIEQMSNNMYNAMYAINVPKIERRPSIHMTNEFDAPKQFTSALKNLLTTKSEAVQAQKENIGFKRAFNPASIHTQIQPAQSPGPSSGPSQSLANQISTQFKMKVAIMPKKIEPKPDIPLDQVYYAVRSRAEGKMQNWVACKLIEPLPQKDNSMLYRIQFYDNLPNTFAIVKGKEIATNSVNQKLKIGARVIAQNTKSNQKNKEAAKKFIPGVIGEKLSKHNHQRYLVFCDYGQVFYADPQAVREIIECSENVWEDVHDNLRQFIFDYLQSQTNRQRALLNVRVGQMVQTERNGEWKDATVAEIDCSIIKMKFNADQTFEWLYRGSKRLGPLFQQGNRSYNTNARRNDPNITYITIDDDVEQPIPEVIPEALAESDQKKNTARKSTAPPLPHMRILQQHQAQFQARHPQAQPTAPIILNDDNIYLDDPIIITKHRHFTPRAGIAAKRYVPHICSPSCVVNPAGKLSQYSPLSKPLLTCWERQIVCQKHNRLVQYKAPCGRRLRDMYEIHKYLKTTKCFLNVDNFDFDTTIQVLAAYDVIDKDKCPLYIPDMSEGLEGMKIPIINAFDDQKPPKLEYSHVRIPMKGVHINTDPEFRACCDCTDDCADKTKCACFQLTIQGMKFAYQNEDLADDDVSYVWKRLLNPVQTGIYECGSHCKCSDRCLNKVVQQPIQIKMQLFRTKNRGWGLECCHDIPKGTFICIYAGRLYREEDANALCLGLNHGDEYFAELDLIETATPLKNGYETGVVYDYEDSETEEEEKASDSDSDYDEQKANEEDVDFVGRPKSFSGREIVTRSTRGKNKEKKSAVEVERKASIDSDSDGVLEMVSMMPKAGNSSDSEPKAHRNLRKFYGKNERVYIMDAKECGNVGRYFNHCCDPNLTVQSVFVDTHDLRFPWIAFFASRAIKAGEEMTWNYNYEVGSVPSKVLWCKCRAKNCRGRIL